MQRTFNHIFVRLLFYAVSIAVAGCAAEEAPPPQTDSPAEQAEELSLRICRKDADCPAPGAPCRECKNGGVACPEVRCEHHQCVYSLPHCPPTYDPCAGKACGEECRLCDPKDPSCIETDIVKYCQADGQCAAPAPSCTVDPCAAVRCAAGTHCDAGACVPDASKVFCGGIAGVPCPGAGRCVDDPSDGCDPNAGGADCGGMCVCGPNNLLCVRGTHWDGSPGVCACVPDAPSGVPCGSNVCPTGQYCCNASCGICAPPGFACIQIACLADN
ncbi:MAG TPA: hypothetical protein VG963_18920 [Polyangiaceae bacterium]|nr:hypothetical protein [Polyangiaceae bacterium]